MENEYKKNDYSDQSLVGSSISKESPLVAEIKDLDKATKVLAEAAATLEVKLGSLMRESYPEQNVGAEEKNLSEVPTQIRRSRYSIQGTTALIQQILSRLEI